MPYTHTYEVRLTTQDIAPEVELKLTLVSELTTDEHGYKTFQTLRILTAELDRAELEGFFGERSVFKLEKYLAEVIEPQDLLAEG